MKISDFWPSEWSLSVRRKEAPTGGNINAAIRDAESMGAWSGILGKWQPRSRSPYLLEALREALPILDGGINRLVTLDGILAVEGGNDKLVQEIEEWMRNVPVNDLETGYQAFYSSHSAEHYEQGVGVGEMVYDARGREVVGLRVADSKGVVFARHDGLLRTYYRPPDAERDLRPDGLGTVEQLLRGSVRGDFRSGMHALGYVELNPQQLVYALHKPEADNPYGTSILRSLPFVAQILLKMENATGRVWTRFGDPIFRVHYGTKNRQITGDEALRRANKIKADLATGLLAKERGNSMDLATAAAADDTIEISVVGADGEELEIEQPARHLLEQVVAGFGLPPWMLGITWSQAAGIGEQQSVVVLQESETRFAVRKPQLQRPIEAMLRARGRTWKPGDWELVQVLPNLMDVQKRAQAGFLQAQTALMLGNSGQAVVPPTPRGIDNNLRTARRHRPSKAKAAGESDEEGEPWAESDPALPTIEADTQAALLLEWSRLEVDALAALGLSPPGDEPFAMHGDQVVALLSLGEARIAPMAADLLEGQLDAWDRGVRNAAADLPPVKSAKGLLDEPAVAEAVARMRERVRAELARTGLQLVRDGIARTYRDRIVAALSSGEFDGWNPVNVAEELQRRFDGGDYNWERLARSEIAMAQSDGKLDLYHEQVITLVDYVTVGDSLVSPVCRELADAGPYTLDKAPVPVRDSHPNCRCTLLASA